MIDRRPALIARCAGVADVIAAMNFARTHQLLVSVRGGGNFGVVSSFEYRLHPAGPVLGGMVPKLATPSWLLRTFGESG